MIGHCMEGLMSVVNITRILEPILMNPMELYLLASCTRARKQVAATILSQRLLAREWSASGKRIVALPAEAG